MFIFWVHEIDTICLKFLESPIWKKTHLFFYDIQDLKDSQLFFNENLQCGDFVLSTV